MAPARGSEAEERQPWHRVAAGRVRRAREGWENPRMTPCLLLAALAEGYVWLWGFQPLASKVSLEVGGLLLGR